MFVGACATTPDETSSGFAPPPIGTEVDWITTYANGAREGYTSRLVAAGDDFAIYLANTESAGDEPYHYYAEFAGGVFYVSCGDPMPTRNGRAAAMDLWPLSPGETADVGGEVLIGPQDSVMVKDQLVDVVWSDYTYQREGKKYTDQFAVAPDFALVVEMRQDLDDGYALGVVRELRFGDDAGNDMPALSPTLLGNCGSLLR